MSALRRITVTPRKPSVCSGDRKQRPIVHAKISCTSICFLPQICRSNRERKCGSVSEVCALLMDPLSRAKMCRDADEMTKKRRHLQSVVYLV